MYMDQNGGENPYFRAKFGTTKNCNKTCSLAYQTFIRPYSPNLFFGLRQLRVYFYTAFSGCPGGVRWTVRHKNLLAAKRLVILSAQG